jgi:hypothetical protein
MESALRIHGAFLRYISERAGQLAGNGIKISAW